MSLAKNNHAHSAMNYSWIIPTLLLCFMLSGCSAIKNATERAKTRKAAKDTTTAISPYLQISPIKGKVISPYGYRGRHRHTGTDIKLQRGDTVRAAFCGRVVRACPYSGYGNLVVLKHANSIQTYYAHLSKCLVQAGDSVLAGQVVGLGGRTGRATTDHLHFEVRYSSSPRDPEHFFEFSTGRVRIPFIAFIPDCKTQKKEETITPAVENLASTNNCITVKKGDTLYGLSKRHGLSVKQLQELNKLSGTNLKIGMRLKIKEAETSR